MAGPKADKLTKERRVEAVYRLILDGWTNEQIRQNTSEWRITERQIARYIDEAWQRIAAVNDVELSEHKRRAVAAQYQLLRECKTVKEKAIVWAAIARLLGLDAPKAVEVSGKDGGPVAHEVEHKGQVHGSTEHVAAVLAALVGVGAVPPPGTSAGLDAEDDAVHRGNANA